MRGIDGGEERESLETEAIHDRFEVKHIVFA
jgi:hypothetical protein